MPKRRITRMLSVRSLIFNVVGVVGRGENLSPFFGEIFGYPFALSLSKGGSTEFVARKDCGTNMSQNQVLVVCSVLSRVPHGLPILYQRGVRGDFKEFVARKDCGTNMSKNKKFGLLTLSFPVFHTGYPYFRSNGYVTAPSPSVFVIRLL